MRIFLNSISVRRILIVFMLFLVSNIVVAQKQDKKKYIPEKPSASITAEWQPVKVEHYIGIRGGYGLGLQRFEPNKPNITQYGLLNFGVAYRFDVPKQKYVGCIEFDLEYVQKSFAYETYVESGKIYSRNYSTIMFPILWQPYLPLGKKGSRFYLNLGPYISYTLSSGSTYRYYDKETNETIDEGTYEYDRLRDNSWEYGCPLGAGFVVSAGSRITIGLDFRYNICLSDILKGINKYESNPFRSPVDQMNVSLGVNYRIPSKVKKTKEEVSVK